MGLLVGKPLPDGEDASDAEELRYRKNHMRV